MNQYYVVKNPSRANLTKNEISAEKKQGTCKVFGPFDESKLLQLYQSQKLNNQDVIYEVGAKYSVEFIDIYSKIKQKAQVNQAETTPTNTPPSPAQPGQTASPNASQTTAAPVYSGSQDKVFRINIGFSSIAVVCLCIVAAYYYWPRTRNWSELYADLERAVVVIETESGLGSGFVISEDGQILTNAHVILDEKGERDPGKKIIVRFKNGREEQASVTKVGTPPLDIALLKIPGSRYRFFELGNREDCVVGSEVAAIGAPQGLEFTLTKGVIGSCDREIEEVGYLQADVPINPGNSGGPIITSDGKVVAISTLTSREAEGLNFGVRVDIVKRYLNGELDGLNATLKKEMESVVQKSERDKENYIAYYKNTYNRVCDIYYDYLDEYRRYLDLAIQKRRIGTRTAKARYELKKTLPVGTEPCSNGWRNLPGVSLQTN